MTVEVQYDLHVTPSGRTFRLFCSVCCPRKCKGKTLLQQSKINRSSKTHTVNRFPREKENSPHGKEEEEHWVIPSWVSTLGCKIHLPFFCLPSPSRVLSSFSVSAPSSFSPNPVPLTVCVLALLRATANDSHLKRGKKKRKESRNRKPSHRKGSRHCMFMGSHYEGAACRRFVWMCF
ncbi:hypothetical protein HJG60_008193 [Phyllostomus discolor]|uniref:Uncharacterized protein n=1 Tax=Phyllostomus discolor TaxID=89673 RepID=A0A834DQ42_9CHIR|nr:hypothetical protein HJG60_008193 [Phyllostomus discolor]